MLNNSIDAVEDARLRVVQHLAPEPLPPRTLNRLEVVLEELITNVVRHGFDAVEGHAMLLAVGTREGAVELVLEDDGRPFNPVEAPEPAAFSRIETAKVGGLGIRAVRRFSTLFDYAASPDSALWRQFIDRAGRPVNHVIVRISSES